MIKKEDISEYIPIMQNEVIHKDFISEDYFEKYYSLAESIRDFIKIDAAEVYDDGYRSFKIVKKKNKYFYFEQKNGNDEKIQIERITKCKTVR